MALRLSRDLSNNKPSTTSENTNTTGFSISGLDGKTYNLDEIEELRNRSSTSSLFVEVKNTKPTENLGNLNSVENNGDLLVGTGVQLKGATNDDYKAYLFSQKDALTKTNQYYVPEITNRHPVVVWNDETLDTSHTEIGETSIVYSKLYELEKVYDTVNSNFAILLADENRPLLEAVSGIKNVVESLKASLLGKEVVNNFNEPNDETIPTTKAIDDLFLKKSQVVQDEVDVDDFLWEGKVVLDAIYTHDSVIEEDSDGNYVVNTPEDFVFVQNSDGDNTYSLIS